MSEAIKPALSNKYRLLKPYLKYQAGEEFELNDRGFIGLIDKLARYEHGGLLRDQDGGICGRFDSACFVEFFVDPIKSPDLFKKVEISIPVDTSDDEAKIEKKAKPVLRPKSKLKKG